MTIQKLSIVFTVQMCIVRIHSHITSIQTFFVQIFSSFLSLCSLISIICVY